MRVLCDGRTPQRKFSPSCRNFRVSQFSRYSLRVRKTEVGPVSAHFECESWNFGASIKGVNRWRAMFSNEQRSRLPPRLTAPQPPAVAICAPRLFRPAEPFLGRGPRGTFRGRGRRGVGRTRGLLIVFNCGVVEACHVPKKRNVKKVSKIHASTRSAPWVACKRRVRHSLWCCLDLRPSLQDHFNLAIATQRYTPAGREHEFIVIHAYCSN